MEQVSATLMKEFDFYRAHQDDMVAKYDGKVVAIKDCKVLGAYDTYLDALKSTSEQHEPGTFLLQRVSEGDADYTATYRSRVTFS